MAHLPCLMIFDDHDITDDWNLSAQWEETAYGHPFSRRIIGNALLGYLLCQAWGNDPDGCKPLVRQCQASNSQTRDELIGDLLRFQAGNSACQQTHPCWCWTPAPGAGAAKATWPSIRPARLGSA